MVVVVLENSIWNVRFFAGRDFVGISSMMQWERGSGFSVMVLVPLVGYFEYEYKYRTRVPGTCTGTSGTVFFLWILVVSERSFYSGYDLKNESPKIYQKI